MKKILIVGAGRGQVDLIKTAKKMGYEVLVATHSDNYPGVLLADKIGYCNITELDKMLDLAKNENVDGVATSCLDTGIEALGYICDNLGLKGLSYMAARRANDKLLMKEAFMKLDVPTAKFAKISNELDLKKAVESMTLPLIIKAVDLQGSRGIYICNTKEDVFSKYDLVMQQTKKEYCILEEFIKGVEFGAEAFVSDGKVLFVLPHGKNNYISETGVPIGHYAPLDRDASFIEQVELVVKSGIRAMELDNCAVNVDLIERDGKVYIIELTGRVGANCLPELVSIYYGIDYYEMILACAMGDSPEEIFKKRKQVPQPNASRMITLEESGVVETIINKNDINDPSIYNITFFVKQGDEVRKFNNSNDCVAQVVVLGDDYDECNRKIEKIKSNISFILK